MKIEKANFGVDNERVSLSVPLAKVDKENRIVSGFATLDNVDTQNDVVTAEASIAAFSRSKARIREMHDKVAVGKILSYKEDEFYDQETDQFYRGVYVNAYVSKGAPNTWEKVLDGTLAAFSIGGAIRDSTTELRKSANGETKSVRIIKDYDLDELSLVDNGANQLANIFSITKMAGGQESVEGLATDVVIENVFYCEEDNIAKSLVADSTECSNCQKVMKNIGWIEADDNRATAVKELVEKVITTKDINNNERSEHMADEKDKKETEVEATDVTETEKVEDTKETETQEDAVEHGDHDEVTVNSASVDDIEGAPEAVKESDGVPDGSNVEKMIGELSELIKTSSAKSEENSAKLISEVEAKLEKAAGEFAEKFESLAKEHGELVEKFNSINSDIASVEKRLGTVEAGTAIKKSGDLGRSADDTKIEKKKETSIWGGTFLGTDSL